MTQLPSLLARATNDLIDAQLHAGATITFTIPTTSMLPTLVPGDQILVRHAKLRELRVGDILLAQKQGIWFAHRLIDQTGGIMTKGDNSIFADEALPESTILGVIIAVRQLDHRLCDLQTRRARWAGKCIAMLSRTQAQLAHRTTTPSIGGRVLLRATRMIVWSVASAARWIMR